MAHVTPLPARGLANVIRGGGYDEDLDRIGGSPLAGSGFENEPIEEILDEAQP